MPTRDVPVHWAPRVRPDKIRRLYQLDAQGLLDASLIDEVGYGLYSRCQSILQVADAMAGRVHCPHCDTIIQRRSSDPQEEQCCPQCGWQTRWETHRERPKFGLGRPTGVNLIEGNRRQVLALLDELTYGTESTPVSMPRRPP